MTQGRFIINILFLFLFSIFACSSAYAEHGEDGAGSKQVMPTFKGWLQGFIAEATIKGISKPTLDMAFKNTKPIQRVIELDRNQPEFKLTFDQYFSKVVDKRRIKRGKWRYQNYGEWIEPIAKQYGVPAQYLIALWGMETDYGRLTGGFSVIDALATLAYDGRRASYFRGELLNALKIIDQGHITANNMKGSWAGAMGQTQFMPSTFLNHAVDYDGDGRKNVWKTRQDALASGANYLAKEGWDEQLPWGIEIKLPEGFDHSLLTDRKTETQKTVSEWWKMGVKPRFSQARFPSGETKANVILLSGEKQRSFIVFKNFFVLMDWNRSHNFATSVGLLADQIKQ